MSIVRWWWWWWLTMQLHQYKQQFSVWDANAVCVRGRDGKWGQSDTTRHGSFALRLQFKICISYAVDMSPNTLRFFHAVRHHHNHHTICNYTTIDSILQNLLYLLKMCLAIPFRSIARDFIDHNINWAEICLGFILLPLLFLWFVQIGLECQMREFSRIDVLCKYIHTNCIQCIHNKWLHITYVYVCVCVCKKKEIVRN